MIRYENKKVDGVIYGRGDTSSFEKQDWLDLAMAVLDQAGLSAAEQDAILAMLPRRDAASELTDLLSIGGGDRAGSAALVADIVAGKLRLPPCFSIRGGTPEQTARAHELARLLVVN